MNIGEKIKHSRKTAGLTQKELGESLGVSAAMIAQYESGKRKPKLETLDKIATALGIDLWGLYDDYELPPIESDIEFKRAWENLLIMNDIRFMSFTKVSGEKGKVFAIDDDRYRYFLTTDQCERLPALSIEQIKTLIKAMADEYQKKDE